MAEKWNHWCEAQTLRKGERDFKIKREMTHKEGKYWDLIYRKLVFLKHIQK